MLQSAVAGYNIYASKACLECTRMSKGSRKRILDSVPLIAAVATLVGAIGTLTGAVLGQNGIFGFRSSAEDSKLPQETVDAQQPNPNSLQDTTRVGSSSVKFLCQNSDGKLSTVVVKNQSAPPVAIIDWNLDNDYFGDEYTPEARCNIVSQRFQNLYNEDKLAFLTTDVSDWETSFGIPIICSVQQSGDSCTEENLLITLENSDDPDYVLEQIMAVRNDPVSNKAVLRTGKESPTFEDGLRFYYDIRELFSEPLF